MDIMMRLTGSRKMLFAPCYMSSPPLQSLLKILIAICEFVKGYLRREREIGSPILACTIFEGLGRQSRDIIAD